MGPLVVEGLEKVVGDILGELVITAILGSNPVTGILQGIRKSYRSAKKSYNMANKAFKMRKKAMAASLQRKIKEQMSKKAQATALSNVRELAEFKRLALTYPQQFVGDMRSIKEALVSDSNFFVYPAKGGKGFGTLTLAKKDSDITQAEWN